MKDKILFVLVVTITMLSFGQEVDFDVLDSIMIVSPNSSPIKLKWLYNCENAKIIAEQDIQIQSVSILIVGGIAPSEYESDEHFEKKYEIKYFDYGCISADRECMLIYNFRVFDFLSAKFGKSWKKEIRKDVYGLKDWKKYKRRSSNE